MEALLKKARQCPRSVTAAEVAALSEWLRAEICSPEDAAGTLGVLLDAYTADLAGIGDDVDEQAQPASDAATSLITEVNQATRTIPLTTCYRCVVLRVFAVFLESLPLLTAEGDFLLSPDDYVLAVLFLMDVADLDTEVVFLTFMDGVRALHRRCIPLVFPVYATTDASGCDDSGAPQGPEAYFRAAAALATVHGDGVASLAQELKSLREQIGQRLLLGSNHTSVPTGDNDWSVLGGGRGVFQTSVVDAAEDVGSASDHGRQSRSLTNAMMRCGFRFFADVAMELMRGLRGPVAGGITGAHGEAGPGGAVLLTGEAAADVLETAKGVAGFLLGPLALHPGCVAATAAAALRGPAATLEELSAPILCTTSPATVTMVLHHIEGLLHLHQTQAPTGGASATPQSVELTTHIVTTLLSHLQNYLLQQHKRTERSSFDSHAASATLRGCLPGMPGTLNGSSVLSATDPLRCTVTRRSLQRTLTVGLRDPALHGMRAALETALAAFGGVADVESHQKRFVELTLVLCSRHLTHVAEFDRVSCVQLVRLCTAQLPFLAAGGIDTTLGRDEFSAAAGGLRSRPGRKGGQETGAAAGRDFEEDEDEDDDGAGEFFQAYAAEVEASKRGARGPILASTIGEVSVDALVEMVMLSVQRMELFGEDISSLHLRGLAQMQYAAAKKAQREEVERSRRIEALGVESVAANKLIFHSKHGSVMAAQGAHTLENPSTRAMLQRAAFLSAFRAYNHIRGEVEGVVRHTQALVARCLVQLPSVVSDASMDALLERIKVEVEREVLMKTLLKNRAQEEEAICRENGGRGSPAAQAALAALPPLVFRGSLVTEESIKRTTDSTSFFQLALQVLFTYYAQQAPAEEANSMSLLSSDHVLMLMGQSHSTGGGALLGATGGGVGASSRLAMQFVADPTINTDDPIAWLLEGADDALDGDGLSGSGGAARRDSSSMYARRKRRHGGGSGSGFGGLDGGANASGGREADQDGFKFFYDDTMQAPCPYSHFLCRLIELIEEAGHPGLLLDLLLECPAITTFVWNYIHQYFCMSSEKSRCLLGMWLLTSIATKRSVYRRFAINSLLYFSSAQKEYPRRLAIVQLGTLLSAASTSGEPGPANAIITEESAKLLISYAKRQVASIPMFRTSYTASGGDAAAGATKRRRRERDDGYGSDDSAHGEELSAAEIQKRERELRKLGDALDRHLGLFLKLCALHPKELVPVLLDVYRECGERENYAMQRLLTNHVDVLNLFSHLFQRDPLQFLTVVMPHLRRFTVHAGPLVQRILWGISRQLRDLGIKERTKARGGDGVADGSGDAVTGTSSFQSAGVEKLRQVAQVLLGHVKAMYEMSRIPVPDSCAGEGLLLHDVRFVAPFFSLIPSKELRETYLLAFVCFVQLQCAHFQRQQARRGPSSRETASAAVLSMFSESHSYRLSEQETLVLIKEVVKEALVCTTIPFSDGLTRGISPIGLMVLLHQAPALSRDPDAYSPEGAAAVAKRSAQQVVSGAMGATGPDERGAHSAKDGSAAPVRGILDDPVNVGGGQGSGATQPGSSVVSAAFGSGRSAPATAPASEEGTRPVRTPVISPKVCKYVIQACLELTRTFDDSTPVRLYDAKEMKLALQRMIRLRPLPTQIMLTVILVAGALFNGAKDSVATAEAHDFVKFVVSTVLAPLARDTVWDTDSDIWRGALIFAEMYYTDCSQFLVGLPDNVLIMALRERRLLQDFFRAEHGNNASFSHILSALD